MNNSTSTNILLVLLIVLNVASIPATVKSIGRPRKPITPREARLYVGFNLVVIAVLAFSLVWGV